MKYVALNLLVLLLVLFLIFENYEVWTHPLQAMAEKERSSKVSGKIENPPGLGTQNEPASIQSYISIAEKNIFSPERKDFPVQPSPEVKKPVSRPQIILYGVAIVDEYQSASVVSPGRPLHKGERETKSLKVGERIGEYRLARIFPDRIRMEGAEDTFEVLLHDSKNPKKKIEVKTESEPAPAAGMRPAVATPAPGAPVPASPPASAEAARPAGPVQENLTAAMPTTRPATPSSAPSRGFRKGKRALLPPAQTAGQVTPAN